MLLEQERQALLVWLAQQEPRALREFKEQPVQPGPLVEQVLPELQVPQEPLVQRALGQPESRVRPVLLVQQEPLV